ncbi:hypothetical protein BGZ99_009334 [Dissophora globulifera]|uniref:Uncharacterized protein n=1 Tax=Dissophora globulifera TaxID=979702 RepID=A0A9P6R7F8_9FUNG|nr:hypothetical protein BGZ99_009334 [Dissophora globulifera]
MRESMRLAVKEATAQLSNPEYFLETEPEKYSSNGYFASVRGMTALNESMVKRLQNEWFWKLIPRLKKSNVEFLRQTGRRLEKAWTHEKRSPMDLLDQGWDERATKKYKAGMRHAFQEHRLKVVQMSSERLENDFTEILDGSPSSAPSVEAARGLPVELTELLSSTSRQRKTSPSQGQSRELASDEKAQEQCKSRSPPSSFVKQIEGRPNQQEEEEENQEDSDSEYLGDLEEPEDASLQEDRPQREEALSQEMRKTEKTRAKWVVDDDQCVGCLIDRYQKDVIQALRRRELKKTDPADTMILGGTFAPWHPTDRMVKVFTHRRLKLIQASLRKDLDKIDINDGCIQSAIRVGLPPLGCDGWTIAGVPTYETTIICLPVIIRSQYKMNDNPTMAVQELGSLQDYRLRMLFEQLYVSMIMNLPRKELEVQSEETLVANNIAPLLRTFVNHVDDDIHTHFPNTESSTQRKQGLKADRPDFKVMIGDKEASFGEVTGRCQRGDKAKNGWDLWRLVRFGKSVLDEGAPMVPLVQIIYDEGTIYRHFVRIRGIMVLAEVGVFTIPTHLNSIGSLQASLPVLYWFQVMTSQNQQSTSLIHTRILNRKLILSQGRHQVA